MLCDFPKAVDDAVLGSHETHRNQMMQILSDPKKAAGFARVVFSCRMVNEDGTTY